MTAADFREHIAKICGIAPLAPRKTSVCLTRTPQDQGYYPQTKFNRRQKNIRRKESNQ